MRCSEVRRVGGSGITVVGIVQDKGKQKMKRQAPVTKEGRQTDAGRRRDGEQKSQVT
jgi:hypothetical protein